MLTQDRAKEIVRQAQEKATCGPWVDYLNQVMSPEERQIVNTYWNSLPGSTCFYDALMDFVNGTVGELG
jgi:hypothetical protein